jgi:hypothetical protein
MGLANLENGLYLDEWVQKYNDYGLQNGTVVAVYAPDANGAQSFVAKFQFADLARCVRSLAFNHQIRLTYLTVRDADPERDNNLYPRYEDSIKGDLTNNSSIAGIQKPLNEMKFVKVVELGECDEKALNFIKEDENAMDMSEVLPGSGVYRRIG